MTPCCFTEVQTASLVRRALADHREQEYALRTSGWINAPAAQAWTVGGISALLFLLNVPSSQSLKHAIPMVVASKFVFLSGLMSVNIPSAVSWPQALHIKGIGIGSLVSYFIYLLLAVTFASTSAFLVLSYAPFAFHSGSQWPQELQMVDTLS